MESVGAGGPPMTHENQGHRAPGAGKWEACAAGTRLCGGEWICSPLAVQVIMTATVIGAHEKDRMQLCLQTVWAPRRRAWGHRVGC